MNGATRQRGVALPNTSIQAAHVLLILYLLTMVFDFRRIEGDDGMFVVAMGSANLVLGGFLLILGRHIHRSTLIWALPFALFLMAAIISGLLRGQAAYDVLSNAVPIAIFLIAMIIVANFRQGRDDGWLIAVISIIALVAIFWKLGFGFWYHGLNVEIVRYQIIAGSVTLVFAYGFTGFVVKRRRLMILAMVAAVTTVALSVTRTYLVVFAIAAIAATLSMPGSRLSTKLIRAGAAAGSLLLALALLDALLPEVFARWGLRLGHSNVIGFDLTGAARIAEAAYQLQQFKADFSGLLFGFGHAAETRLAGRSADLVAAVLGAQAVSNVGQAYGHNFFLGLIFVGGLLFGLPVVATFSLLIVRAWLVARAHWRKLTDHQRFMLIWGISASSGYLAYGALAAPWSDRSLSLFFGIAIGLIVRVLVTSRRSRIVVVPPRENLRPPVHRALTPEPVRMDRATGYPGPAGPG